jgi:adenylate kinase family enzyme
MTFRHIHITGASGSGATTLGSTLAARTGMRHLDTDDFYWHWPPDAAPYTMKRAVPERLGQLRAAFAEAGPRGWVLSGAVGDWAEPIVPQFDLVVFLWAPTDVRVERLWHRENARFGAAAEVGGARRREIEDFIAWAAAYDSGTREGRSLARHEAWLGTLSCPVLRLDGRGTLDGLVAAVMNG